VRATETLEPALRAEERIVEKVDGGDGGPEEQDRNEVLGGVVARREAPGDDGGRCEECDHSPAASGVTRRNVGRHVRATAVAVGHCRLRMIESEFLRAESRVELEREEWSRGPEYTPASRRATYF
jgi:hypothetical protein